MITIYLQGGLGNQLFQIFTCIAYALRHNIKFNLPLYNQNQQIAKSPGGCLRPTFWDNFFINLKKNVVDNTILYKNKPRLSEKDHNYNEIPKINQDFMLTGYFQSYKYFQDQFDSIAEIININLFQKKIKEQYKDILIGDTISMHFRLGDYKKNVAVHNILSIDYYICALTEIMQKTNKDNFTVVYFCEDEDVETVKNNINQIKQIHKNCQFERGKGEDWEELLLMSICNHNIIANSSFSWWGAYFNKNTDKIVCRPNKWFNIKFNNFNDNDLSPDTWIKFQ